MIVYFSDRKFNVIGQASTTLPEGLIITEDKVIDDVETGISTLEISVHYTDKNRGAVENYTAPGNYLLAELDNECKLYTIIDRENDTDKSEIYIYAEDDGLDLLNEVVEAYEADKAYPISHYINKWAAGAGFVIGRNEAKSLTRQLSWDSETTAAERIASVAAQFGGCEISYTFKVDGLFVTKKYINIYKQRGKDIGATLRLNKDIDYIITKESIANIATALQCRGSTPDSSATILEATSTAATPNISYEVSLEVIKRTSKAVKLKASVRAALTGENSVFGEGYVLKASLYMGGSWHSETIKKTDEEWEGDYGNTTDFSFTLSGLSAGTIAYTDIKFKVTRSDSLSGSAGVLSETACAKFIIPNYIPGATGAVEEGETLPITLDGYTYDDGDFYVDGNLLKSRKALKTWGRYLWRTDETAKAGGHVVKQFQYEALEQNPLCEAAIAELKKLREMEVNYDASITNLPDNVRIGDRINIVDEAGELYLSTRVLVLERSETGQDQKATLGEHKIKSSGIHKKVLELAEQFSKQAVSAKRALSAAKSAKNSAASAQKKSNAAEQTASAAKQAANTAQDTANAASESAQAAQQAANHAQELVENVENTVGGFEQDIADALLAAEHARQAAETAEERANEAQQAAGFAEAKAEEAKQANAATQETAENAITKAEDALGVAEQAQDEAEAAATIAAAARLDAQAAQNEIDSLGDRLTTVSNTMSAEYARKTDLTEATANLQSQISRNAAEINATVTRFQTIDETANNAAELAAQAQESAEEAQQLADEATAVANEAQANADNTTQAALEAQEEAETARNAANEAQAVATSAAAELEAAENALANILEREDATEAEIAEAQAAVTVAQTAADQANTEAQAAITAAQTAADQANTAAETAASAQATAQAAQEQAKQASLLANEANNAAVAADIAMNASLVAGFAVSAANKAQSDSIAAQTAANEAVEKANFASATAQQAQATLSQAQADLTEAQQRLADVLANVEATQEEVAAAQEEVTIAQSYADKANADAVIAEEAAEQAQADSEAAQAKAQEAAEYAEQAQTAASAAQTAADKATEDVNNLAKRLTSAEAGIAINADSVKISAARTEEVFTALSESQAAQKTEIEASFDEILLSALSSYVNTGDYDSFKETMQAKLTLLSDEMKLSFEVTTEEGTTKTETENIKEIISKYFRFSGTGLTITAGNNTMNLKIDNDIISFEKDGQQFGWWDGVDFHTSNIYIDLDRRAQFGNFAFVPRSNGSLDFLFLKVGG